MILDLRFQPTKSTLLNFNFKLSSYSLGYVLSGFVIFAKNHRPLILKLVNCVHFL